MHIVVQRILWVCAGCLLLQACASPPKQTIDDNARIAPDGREGLVIVEQGELRANIEVSHVEQSMGAYGAVGVLVGAIVDTRVNQNRADAAEVGVKALRDELIDYDFDHRAAQGFAASAGKLSWIDIRKFDFSKNGTKDNVLGILDHGDATQLVLARYSYVLSPKFDALLTGLQVDIFPKEAAPGASSSSRLDRDKAVYSQRFVFVEPLPQATKKMDQNASLWAKEDGKGLRAALDAGLSGVDNLFVRSVSLSAADAANLDKGRHVDLADQHGDLVETSEKGTLLYDKDLGTWTFIDGMPAPSK